MRKHEKSRFMPKGSDTSLIKAVPRAVRKGRGSVLLLALLVSNAARGLASGLAGSLALAASAGLNGLFHILSLNGLDSLHEYYPPIDFR